MLEARDLGLNPLPHRAIQIGLSGEAVDRYVDDWITSIRDVDDWITSIRDVTPLAHQVRVEVTAADTLLPPERPYPLPDDLAARVGRG